MTNGDGRGPRASATLTLLSERCLLCVSSSLRGVGGGFGSGAVLPEHDARVTPDRPVPPDGDAYRMRDARVVVDACNARAGAALCRRLGNCLRCCRRGRRSVCHRCCRRLRLRSTAP